MALFRVEIIDKEGHLLACNTFSDYATLMEKYKNITEHYKSIYQSEYNGAIVQVFTGLNWENLKEQKDLEVDL